jgi:nondiscriminating glutamyl-tRNA synthetase
VSSKVRVRFAPSPTGRLHVGNARTAVFNYLFARARDGKLVLRVEDTDAARSTVAFQQELMDDLRWLGVTWDEGPDTGGDFGPYLQSARLELYQAHVARLTEAGLTFRCFCTDDELEADRQYLRARKLPPRYVGRCRDLTDEEQRRKEAEGRRATIRFRVEDQDVTFTDLIRGDKKFPAGSAGDFVLLRADGTPTYTLAAVVDDTLMEISHVIRGEDHLTNTARQLLLYKALGYSPPVFAHHSLLVGPDKQKLSKRHGATSVREFREAGVLPEALANYLAYLGGGLAGSEFFIPEDLAQAWDLRRTGKAAAVFDRRKLDWFNHEHLRRMSPARLADRLTDGWRAAGFFRNKKYSREEMEAVSAAISPMTLSLADGVELAGPFFVAPSSVKVPPKARGLFEALARDLAGVSALTPEAAKAMILGAGRAAGLKGRALFHPLRLALTGRERGCELDLFLSVIGPTEGRRRLAAVSFEE